MSWQPFISDRFRNALSLHIFKQMCSVPGVAVPLLLGVHGPSGSGKTFQCEFILSELGVKVFPISGGELESSVAGRPAELLRQTYVAASNAIRKGETLLSAVVINDFDTGGGNWGDLVQTTINSQTLFGELMHLCDYPLSVERSQTERIPIILTGNDFTKLYKPLIRSGRMSLFEWAPSHSEIASMIAKLFPTLSEADCKELSRAFPSEQISFFAHLKGVLFECELLDKISFRNQASVVKDLQENGNDFALRYNLGRLVELGRELKTSNTIVNHLMEALS